MLFIGLFIFSNVYAYDVKYAYERTLVYFRAWTFLAAIALFLRSWKALFYSLLFSIGLSVLSNVFLSYNYLKDPELLAMVALKGDILRAKGFIFDPNYAALSSIVVIPLVLPFFKKANSKIIKIILLICLLVFIFSIFLTFSRMGVIVLALLGAYFLFKERSNRWVWITIAILTIFVIFWLPDMFFTRISNLFSGKLDDSLVQRIRILKGGFKMFLDQPIKGVGIGNFAYLSQNYIPEVSKERYAHNLYLETVAELGIIGFFVFLFMIWQTLTYLWNIQKVSKKVCQDLYYTAYALELSFIGFLVGSIFLSTMHSTYLWGLIGIVIALKSISDKAMPLENNHTIHS
jgi:O-antigen ligase